MNEFLKSIIMFFVLTAITGIFYPLLITGIGWVFVNEKAEGSFLIRDNQKIGSSLIAQGNKNEKYFWPRPSTNNYNPLASGGSNLGATSRELRDQVEARKEKFTHNDNIPSELLYASGSGLDPHISPETAFFQVERVIKARGLDREAVIKLIKDNTEGFILGEPVVNVLKLNLSLDEMR